MRHIRGRGRKEKEQQHDVMLDIQLNIDNIKTLIKKLEMALNEHNFDKIEYIIINLKDNYILLLTNIARLHDSD